MLPGLNPVRVRNGLLLLILALASLHLGLGAANLLFDSESITATYALFNMGSEYNVPAFVSSALWLLAAGMACANSMARPASQHPSNYWLALALLCAFLGLDEAIMIHETLVAPVRELSGATGAFHYAWTLVYGPLALTVALLFGRFVFSLDPNVRWRIIAGGIIFVSGALGMEMVESHLTYELGKRTLLLRLGVTLEETLELLGLSVFVHALVLQLREQLDHGHRQFGACRADRYAVDGMKTGRSSAVQAGSRPVAS